MTTSIMATTSPQHLYLSLPPPPGLTLVKEENGNNDKGLHSLRTLQTLLLLLTTPLAGVLVFPPPVVEWGMQGGYDCTPHPLYVDVVVVPATTRLNRSARVSAPPAPLPSSFLPWSSSITFVVPLLLILIVLDRRCHGSNTGAGAGFVVVVVVVVLVPSSSSSDNVNDNNGSIPNLPSLLFLSASLLPCPLILSFPSSSLSRQYFSSSYNHLSLC